MHVTRFDQIIGHKSAIERLRRDIDGGRAPNAYLFAGPEGVGKATVAFLVATAMLCVGPFPADRPCGSCGACRRADGSNHPDFHRVSLETGKRQIRIDQVRELQSRLALRPYEAEWKVVVIDRAEALNEAAQNALLKTLEEPPGNALIVLVAPSPQVLLPTIVSRSRIERFGPLRRDELAGLLTKERDLDDDEARLVAGLAGGSVGMALAMDMDFVREGRPLLLGNLARLALDTSPTAEKVLGVADMILASGEEGLAVVSSWLKDVAIKKLGLGEPVHTDLRDDIARVADHLSMKAIIERFQATLSAREGLMKNLHEALTYENLVLAML